MPIGLETATGYWDLNGVFHPNTALTPSPFKGINWTYPITSGSPYDILPQVMPSVIPSFTMPDLSRLIPKIPGLNINVDMKPLVLPLLAVGAVLLLGKKY